MPTDLLAPVRAALDAAFGQGWGSRCPWCGFGIGDRKEGCAIGDCSMRPRPVRLDADTIAAAQAALPALEEALARLEQAEAARVVQSRLNLQDCQRADAAERERDEARAALAERIDFTVKMLGNDLCQAHLEEARSQSFPEFVAATKAAGCPRCTRAALARARAALEAAIENQQSCFAAGWHAAQQSVTSPRRIEVDEAWRNFRAALRSLARSDDDTYACGHARQSDSGPEDCPMCAERLRSLAGEGRDGE